MKRLELTQGDLPFIAQCRRLLEHDAGILRNAGDNDRALIMSQAAARVGVIYDAVAGSTSKGVMPHMETGGAVAGLPLYHGDTVPSRPYAADSGDSGGEVAPVDQGAEPYQHEKHDPEKRRQRRRELENWLPPRDDKGDMPFQYDDSGKEFIP